MNKPLVLIAAALALLCRTYGAKAFTTEPANPLTINNRLLDPDELADKLSNGQSSGATYSDCAVEERFSSPPHSRVAA